MSSYFHLLLPELVLCGVACVLMLLGCSDKPSSRRAAPMLALITLVCVFVMLAMRATGRHSIEHTEWDVADTLRLFHFATYVKLLTAGVGVILLLLAWPTNADATGNSAMNVGQETAEFFSLMLLSLTGIFLVAGANDLILLFLGIELASIPTYIMVSISRPLPIAQEAGVKYFFLGAMAAAVMLFGFSYLYGVTGSTRLDVISNVLHPPAGQASAASTALAPWQMLAVVMLVAGFAFKLAAVPLHVYAGDVYQGAATPVTAFLSFVPKTSGMVALIKILYAVGGPHWALPPIAVKLLWVVAALTMTFGNAVATTQIKEVKRMFAYSSIAHSGYMLVGVTALAGAYGSGAKDPAGVQATALQGILFYLAAYGVSNAAAFGVLMMLPSRDVHGNDRPATGAETIEDLAGQGRRHPSLGLCMTVCCMSLTGIPLTVGFIGKLMLVKPALGAGLNWLAVITVLNAAVSAAYYLRIVATMFLRDPVLAHGQHEPPPPRWSLPIGASVALSVVGAILLGTAFPLTQVVSEGARRGAQLDDATAAPAAVTADVALSRSSP